MIFQVNIGYSACRGIFDESARVREFLRLPFATIGIRRAIRYSTYQAGYYAPRVPENDK